MYAPGEHGLLLRPGNVALIVLDHRDDPLTVLSIGTWHAFAASTHALAKIAKACNVPVVLGGMSSEAFQGETWPPHRDDFRKAPEIQREHIDCWDDKDFVSVVSFRWL